MARSGWSEIARKAAKLVVLINALPTPDDPGDRASLEGARQLAADIENRLWSIREGGREGDAGLLEKLRGWIDMLARIIIDLLLRRRD